MTRNLLALGVLLGACTADVPSSPSFQQHVLPILAANCVRCHGYPAIGGAPRGFRLDSYGDVAIDDETKLTGAGAYAPVIAARIGTGPGSMPPRFPLDDPQIETLERWAQAAAPGEPAPRGEPRPGNRPPEAAIESVSRAGYTVGIVVRVDDPDGDLVAGELRVQIGGTDRVIGPVRSGRVELAWNTAFVSPGSHPITAVVDDGAMPIAIELGQIIVGGP